MMSALHCIAPLLAAALAAQGHEPPLRGEDSWGGRARHIAVVNQIGAATDGTILSLRGEWDFIAHANGRSGPPSNIPLSCYTWPFFLWTPKFVDKESGGSWKIRVPGCWESQGVGTVITGKPWRCHDRAPRRIHGFTGDAWYHKDVTVPGWWKGRRIWLKVGGVNSFGRFWVNDRPVAMVSTYCGTYKWEITDLVGDDGAVRIVAGITNSEPSRRGLYNSENRWGGIVRDIELEATPATFIDDAWARGDFDARAAEVHVELKGEPWDAGAELRVSIEGAGTACVAAKPGENVVRLPLQEFRPWSPERPNLYTAKIELLSGGKVSMARMERFGVRKIEVCGDEFRLNGKPFFFRGAGWHMVDPLHGEIPADREYLRKLIRRIRAAGFNAVRFHTHCKWPECFEVADEEGLMIQPELPYYNDWTCDYFSFDPVGDALELWRNFRRHPSFAVYSGGNEGDFGPDLSPRLYAFMKKTDPDRLFYGQDAITKPVKTETIKRIYGLDDARLPKEGSWLRNGPDCSDITGGPKSPWPRGTFNYGRPFICHEYLNLTVKTDVRLEPRYTGVWLPPLTRDDRARWLARFGLDAEFGDRLQDAQHVLQRFWIKHGFECARNDPYCDGYSYWSLQDTSVHAGEAVSAQGMFNAFMEEKPCGTTFADCRAFNFPACLTLDRQIGFHLEEPTSTSAGGPAVPVVTLRSGDAMPFAVHLQNYCEDDIEDAVLEWKVEAGGRKLSGGRQDLGRQAVGPVREVLSVAYEVPRVETPVKAVMTAALNGRTGGKAFGTSNSWEFWFYPAGFPTCAETRKLAASAGIAIGTPDSPEVKRAIAEGRNAITVFPLDPAGTDSKSGSPNVQLGWWRIGSQVGMVFARHPALSYLPHDGVLSPLFFRMVKTGALKLPVEGVTQKDLLVVGEGRDACYAYMAVRRHPNGAKEVLLAGMDVFNGTPEADALLRGTVEWLAGKEER